MPWRWAFGLLGVSHPILLGLTAAVLAWVPYIGSAAGCVLVVLVSATDFPNEPVTTYGCIVLFLCVRMLDDFVFLPLTIGRSLRIHPVLSVIMLFLGAAVAGPVGLLLVLPRHGRGDGGRRNPGPDPHRSSPPGPLPPRQPAPAAAAEASLRRTGNIRLHSWLRHIGTCLGRWNLNSARLGSATVVNVRPCILKARTEERCPRLLQ